MNNMLIRVCWILLAILLVVYYALKKKEKRSVDSIFTKGKKTKSSNQIEERMYQAFIRNPITRGYAKNLQDSFESYYPGEKSTVHHLVVMIIASVGVIVTITIALVFVLLPTWDTFLGAVLFVYVVSRELTDAVIWRTEEKILIEIDRFLSFLQFNYMQIGMVDVALHDSIVGKCPLVDKHANVILKVLEADDVDSARDKYLLSVRNSFLKELMCICVTISQYGDFREEGQSCFLLNLKNLKDRVGEERIIKNEIKYKFRLLPVLSVLAVFASTALMQWASETISDLEPYYNSYYGYVVKLVIPLITLLCYVYIKRLKAIDATDLSLHRFLTKIADFPAVRKLLSDYYNRNYGKYLQTLKMLKRIGSKLTAYTLVIKQVLFAGVAFVCVLISVVWINYSVKERVVNEITGTGSKSSAATEEMSVKMLMLIRHYTDEWLAKDVLDEYQKSTGVRTMAYDAAVDDWVKQNVLISMQSEYADITDEQAMQAVMQYNKEHSQNTKLYLAYLGTKDGAIREENDAMYEAALKQFVDIKASASEPAAITVPTLQESMATDVANAVSDYNNAYLHWYHALAACAISIISFFIPYYWLALNKGAMQCSMETEVRQFYSLLSVLRSTERMSSDEILNWMFKFSVVFKQSIHKCIVHFSSGEEKAFQQLLKDESFESFQTVVRSLTMIDEVGIKQAFVNLSIDQKNYAEYWKQSTLQRINDNCSVASLVLLAPYAAVLILVLLYPLFTESMGQLTNSVSQMLTM